MKDSKLRFSNRAEDYVRYRPGYPSEVLAFLEEECGLTTASVVADVGSGTGISLDLEGLKGLLLSHLSVPAEGEPGSEAMLRDLEGVFRANESGGGSPWNTWRGSTAGACGSAPPSTSPPAEEGDRKGHRAREDMPCP